MELITNDKKNKLILNADNDGERRMFETCQLKGKRVFNPIVDWSDEQVWEFLNHYGCESNPLYYQDFKRIGCIGCPMARKRIQMFQFTR
jgi:phosphoadenosine phosphosulfate reductase